MDRQTLAAQTLHRAVDLRTVGGPGRLRGGRAAVEDDTQLVRLADGRGYLLPDHPRDAVRTRLTEPG